MPATVKSRGRKAPLVSNKDKKQDKEIRLLKEIVLADKKYLHTDLAATGVLSSSALAPLVMPSQGDNVIQRDGDTVKWLGLQGNHVGVAGDSTNLLRFIIFQWRPDNSVEVPSMAKLLQTSNTPSSVYILDQKARKKFKVLYDSCQTLSTISDTIKMGKINVPASKMINTYFTQGAITGNNVIYYFTLSDSVAAPNPTLQFNFTALFES